MALKILHVNDHGVSVPRIINSAKTAKSRDNHVYFCGSSLYSYLEGNSIFDKSYNIGWVNKKWLWLKWPAIKKSLGQVLDELRPDLIHCHNIFAAKVVSEFDYPFIMDDHELFSLEFKASIHNSASRIIPNVQFRLASYMCSIWEKKIAERAPIITISQEIANVYRKMSNKVFVVPNFPTTDAIPIGSNILLHASPDNMVSVYFGADRESNPHEFRNISGLHNTFRSSVDIGSLVRIGIETNTEPNIESLGFLPIREAYEIMQERCHIGLVPWKPHWFHKYCSPSKAYEYAHCGLYVMVTHNLQEVVSTMDSHCDTYGDFTELTEKLRYLKNNPDELNNRRKATLDYARRHLTWEKHEQKILDAYKCC